MKHIHTQTYISYSQGGTEHAPQSQYKVYEEHLCCGVIAVWKLHTHHHHSCFVYTVHGTLAGDMLMSNGAKWKYQDTHKVVSGLMNTQNEHVNYRFFYFDHFQENHTNNHPSICRVISSLVTTLPVLRSCIVVFHILSDTGMYLKLLCSFCIVTKSRQLVEATICDPTVTKNENHKIGALPLLTDWFCLDC